MQPPSNASPDELKVEKPTKPFRRRVFFAAACSLVLFFFAMEASGSREETLKPPPRSPAAGKPAAAKIPVKPPVRTVGKSKKAPSKQKAKGVARSTVSEKTKSKAEVIASEISSSLPESLEKRISKFYGLRYRMGGEGRDGIDCSGLVQKVYSDVFGIELPRSSSEQSRLDSLESVTEDELKPGDLVFFGHRRKRVNHVGLYLASGYFLHASRSEGVTISRLDDGYWKSRWIFSKRARGLEAEYDSGQDRDLERTLERYSAGFAFSGASSDTGGFLEAGIQINGSLEFLLSGYSLSTLDDRSTLPDLDSFESLQETQFTGTEGAFRLAAVFSPSERFKVIPSVSRTEAGKEDKNRGGNRQQLGIETRIILPSTGIAVFMAAHADTLQDLMERPLHASPDWQTLDVALGLHYRLTDSFRFSLWGTHGGSQNLKENEEPGRSNLPIDDISFQLDFKF